MTVVTYKNVKRPIIPVGDLPMLALFARGEQGAWYDPSDLYNYTGGDYGSELLPGGFSNPADWTLGLGWAIEDGVASRPATTSWSNLARAIPSLVAGRIYRVEVDFAALSGGAFALTLGAGSTGPAFNSPGKRVFFMRAGDGSKIAYFQATGASTEVALASVSVKEVISSAPTMFQDAAGTIPVTGVEQPVGLILDKSGNGNHASQTTTTARPMLSARVNLVTDTSRMGADWQKLNTTAEPDGDAIRITAVGDSLTGGAHIGHGYNKHNTLHTFSNSVDLKAGTYGWARLSYSTAGNNYGVTINLATGEYQAQNVHSMTVTPLDDGWYRVTVSRQNHSYALHHFALFMTSYSGPSDAGYRSAGNTPEPGQYIYARKPQMEASAEATKYQRVNTATDYDWQGWPLYLQRDGVDDMLQSGSGMPLDANWHLVHAGHYPKGTNTGVTSGFCIAPPGTLATTNHFGIGYRPSAQYAGAMLRYNAGAGPLVTVNGVSYELAGGTHIMEGWTDGVSVSISADGAAAASTPIPEGSVYGPTPACLFLTGARSYTPAQDRIADHAVLAVNRQLTSEERAAIRKFLSDKIKVPA